MIACLVNIILLFICIILINFTNTNCTCKINPFIGYRTKRSTKSEKAWKYANTRITELMVIIMVIYLIINIIIALLLTIFQLNILYIINYIIIISEVPTVIIIPTIILEIELEKNSSLII